MDLMIDLIDLSINQSINQSMDRRMEGWTDPWGKSPMVSSSDGSQHRKAGCSESRVLIEHSLCGIEDSVYPSHKHSWFS